MQYADAYYVYGTITIKKQKEEPENKQKQRRIFKIYIRIRDVPG